eukprot:scaffold152935_cov34-Tisochrysis_lutea.AAC.1
MNAKLVAVGNQSRTAWIVTRWPEGGRDSRYRESSGRRQRRSNTTTLLRSCYDGKAEGGLKGPRLMEYPLADEYAIKRENLARCNRGLGYHQSHA